MRKNKLLFILAVSEVADDNNCIDRLVTKHRPTHVIIEAYWVVPEKFDVLMPLHRDVRWIVRNHSEIPFISSEGIAMEWTRKYLERGIEVMCNSPRAVSAYAMLAIVNGSNTSDVTYGPNAYPIPPMGNLGIRDRCVQYLDIGCFGAIRPLKNHLIQAFASLAVANDIGARLRFHINATRVEGNANSALKNLQGLFEDLPNAELVLHSWMDRSQFLEVMGTMDVSLQMSYSETFNIVTADAMYNGVPVVVSPEIPWIGAYAHRDPNDFIDIAGGIREILFEGYAEKKHRLERQRRDMIRYTDTSRHVWVSRFGR